MITDNLCEDDRPVSDHPNNLLKLFKAKGVSYNALRREIQEKTGMYFSKSYLMDCIKGKPLSKKEMKMSDVEVEIGSNIPCKSTGDCHENMGTIYNPNERHYTKDVRWYEDEGYRTLQDLCPDPVLIFQDGNPKMASSAFFNVF